MQDSYALCRVFKKNGICSDTEDQQQAQCSLLMMDSPQGVINNNNNSNIEYETTSPDVPITSSSYIDEDDKDDSWMQFITDDAWCSSSTGLMGVEEVSQHVAFTN